MAEEPAVSFDPWQMMTAATEYMTDAWQRAILILDVLRERGTSTSSATVRATRRCWRSTMKWSSTRGSQRCPKVPSTVEAAALCKMADRDRIMGVLAGPLALDNAISPRAAQIKKIASPVAGRANVLIFAETRAELGPGDRFMKEAGMGRT
jgi:hypothetical protein